MHISELGKRPRKIELLSTNDGFLYEFFDDGAGPYGPNAKRQALIAALAKRNRLDPTMPAFVLPAGTKYEPVVGDIDNPLFNARTLDDNMKPGVEKSVTVRAERNHSAEKQMASEVDAAKKKAAAELKAKAGV